MRSRQLLYLLVLVPIVVGLGLRLIWFPTQAPQLQPGTFDGERAYRHVMAQMAFGPRITGSEGNRKAGDYIVEQLTGARWLTGFQEFTYQNASCRNVIGRANVGKGPVIIVGAHYDTRRWSDQDPDHPRDPVPGANDGASGVAVLLELARTLNLQRVRYEIWLVFFDAEDNGGINGWNWIVGSTYMASNLSIRPQAMILVDMVGDVEQQIYFDGSSDRALSEKIWSIAARLGYGKHFLPQVRWYVVDDHTPFMQLGIPAVNVIDLDYAYWHTTADTIDKVSSDSLERVGRTIQVFLELLE